MFWPASTFSIIVAPMDATGLRRMPYLHPAPTQAAEKRDELAPAWDPEGASMTAEESRKPLCEYPWPTARPNKGAYHG